MNDSVINSLICGLFCIIPYITPKRPNVKVICNVTKIPFDNVGYLASNVIKPIIKAKKNAIPIKTLNTLEPILFWNNQTGISTKKYLNLSQGVPGNTGNWFGLVGSRILVTLSHIKAPKAVIIPILNITINVILVNVAYPSIAPGNLNIIHHPKTISKIEMIVATVFPANSPG